MAEGYRRQLHVIFADNANPMCMNPAKTSAEELFASGQAEGEIGRRRIKAMWIVEQRCPTQQRQIVRIWGTVPQEIRDLYKEYLVRP